MPDQQLSDRVILVADDDEMIRRALGRLLSSQGYTVHLAECGATALRLLEHHPIQLIICDYDMPEMSGLDVLKQVRERFPKVCRIMMTGTTDLEIVVQAINEGEIYRFVHKPWDNHLLASTVHVAFETLRLEAELERERARSERLLLNVLPGPIAERLKAGESPIADEFSEATILFADLVGFTELSQRMPPGQLVELLDELFSAFDAIATSHGVEKIKTIGDAYMAVAGLPIPRHDHAAAIAEVALEVFASLEAFNRRRGLGLKMRIGINSGPVIAGVMGKHKFAYDLWGDAVNTASRMESHGVPGRIHVGQATFAC